MRLRQESLLREAIRAEIRAYNHTSPLATELVLYEGLWDSIKGVASKAMKFGKNVAQDFKKGWERVSSIVSEALSSVNKEITEKVKSFIESISKTYKTISEKVKSYGEEKVRRFLSVFKHEHDHATEGKEIAEESKTNNCVDAAIESMGEKAEALDSDSPKVKMSMDEGWRMARTTKLMVESRSRKILREGKGRGLLKEAFDPLSISGIILTFGAVMLMFKALAAVFKFVGGECANFWTKASGWCQKAYDKMHHFEEAALDTLIPDKLAVGFYDFYIFCGFAPVEGDPGKRMTNRWGTEDFGEESAEYKKGKLKGKFGASRDVEVEDLKGNDKFRRAVKVRMYQTALLYMLADALMTIAAQGLTALYGVKSAVKTGELGVAAAGEVSAAMKAGRAAAG